MLFTCVTLCHCQYLENVINIMKIMIKGSWTFTVWVKKILPCAIVIQRSTIANRLPIVLTISNVVNYDPYVHKKMLTFYSLLHNKDKEERIVMLMVVT